MQTPIHEFTADELDTLHAWEKCLIEMAVHDKHSYEATAEFYGLPVGTVKSRINRVRGKIAKLRAAQVAAAPAEERSTA